MILRIVIMPSGNPPLDHTCTNESIKPVLLFSAPHVNSPIFMGAYEALYPESTFKTCQYN